MHFPGPTERDKANEQWSSLDSALTGKGYEQGNVSEEGVTNGFTVKAKMIKKK